MTRPYIPAHMLHRIVEGKPDLRPTRHVVIKPAVPWWEVLALYAVAALIGVLLATGGVL